MKNLLLDRKFIIIFFIVIFIAIIVFGLVGIKCGTGEKIISIDKGMGSDEVAQKLKDEGVINNKWVFVLYVWLRGYNTHLQAGEYLVKMPISIPKVAGMIASGEIAQNYAKITVPEGWTSKQIQERLIILGTLKQGDKLPQEQEGYLFPDTYFFEKNSSVETVVSKMRNNFDSKITDEMKDEIQRQGKALYDILKMASILEKEVKSDEDRAIVSGIFWKRIANKMPLQADITLAYILGIDKRQYSYEDTLVKSPYNTYLNLGLPPTPINNPGLSAIKAAIYPKQTDYLYFLSASDGTTIYAKTLAEHSANKAKYLK